MLDFVINFVDEIKVKYLFRLPTWESTFRSLLAQHDRMKVWELKVWWYYVPFCVSYFCPHVLWWNTNDINPCCYLTAPGGNPHEHIYKDMGQNCDSPLDCRSWLFIHDIIPKSHIDSSVLAETLTHNWKIGLFWLMTALTSTWQPHPFYICFSLVRSKKLQGSTWFFCIKYYDIVNYS